MNGTLADPPSTDGAVAEISVEPASEVEASGAARPLGLFPTSSAGRIKLALKVLAVWLVLELLRRMLDQSLRKGRRMRRWWRYSD